MIFTAEFNRIRDSLATLALTSKQDHVRITAAPQSVVLTTADNAAMWALQIPARVTETGEAYVPFKRFRGHFSAYDGGEMDVTLTEKSLHLLHAGAKGNVPLIDPTTFPSPSKFGERPITKFVAEMPSLVTAVAGCFPVTGQKPGYEYTTGIQIVTDSGGGCLFATDRVQAAHIQLRGSGDAVSFTVDARQLAHVATMPGESVIIEFDGSRAKFKNEHFLSYLQVYQHNPPDVPAYLDELVKNSSCRVKIPAVFLMEALSLAQAVAGDRESFYAYLELGAEGCRLKATGDQAEEIDADLHATANSPLKAYINHITLLRCLRAFLRVKLCDQHIELLYRGGRDPLVILFSEDGLNRYAVSAIVPPDLEPTHNPPT